MNDSTTAPVPVGWPAIAVPDCVAPDAPKMLYLAEALVYLGLSYSHACNAQLRRDLGDKLPTEAELEELSYWASELINAYTSLLSMTPVAGYRIEVLISSYDRFRPVVQDEKRDRVWVGSLRLDRAEAVHAGCRAALRLILALPAVAETPDDDEQPTDEVKARIDAIQVEEAAKAKATNEANGSVAVQAQGGGSIQDMMAQAAIDYAKSEREKAKGNE